MGSSGNAEYMGHWYQCALKAFLVAFVSLKKLPVVCILGPWLIGVTQAFVIFLYTSVHSLLGAFLIKSSTATTRLWEVYWHHHLHHHHQKNLLEAKQQSTS